MINPQVFREKIDEMYPYGFVHLKYIKNKPWTLLFAVILSAQCTDARVNIVTPTLFEAFPTLNAFKKATIDEIRHEIRTISFPQSKAKYLKRTAEKLLRDFGGIVPDNMQELTSLAGVGRKTANVVAHVIHGVNLGFVVDTHIKRIAFRTGQTNHVDPKKVEKDLIKLHPQESWGRLAHKLVQFGRDVCDARKPKCQNCVFKEVCPKKRVKF